MFQVSAEKIIISVPFLSERLLKKTRNLLLKIASKIITFEECLSPFFNSGGRSKMTKPDNDSDQAFSKAVRSFKPKAEGVKS